MTDLLPPPPEHPELSPEELARQRGREPENPVGHRPDPPAGRDPDPGYVPDPDQGDRWRRQAGEIGREHRPRREDVFPYLLMRAYSPGDRGRRPTWPPTVCWESPDILLHDASYTGPFDPTRLVASPAVGRTYRVFVRVWNLGLFPALGIHVQAWAVNPGFIGVGNQDDPYYRKHHIGGAWIDELTDRRSPGCTAVIELDQPWTVDPDQAGHQCLIASVTCPADHFDGPLLVNTDRHVGQRNLDVRGPDADTGELIRTLGGLVPRGHTLELTHGGPAAVPLLQALSGGILTVDDRRVDITAPALEEVRGGVDNGVQVHLLTAFESDGRTVIARSDRLRRFAEQGRPFSEAGGTRRLLEQLGPRRWDEVGIVTDTPLAESLTDGIVRMLDLRETGAHALASVLGGPEGAQHLLRFTLTTAEGDLVGGYSIVVS
jgi:hypothetical protein